MTYDFVFVVLVYRNTTDLEEFFAQLSCPNCRVVVVNSYYDDATKNKFETIAKSNGADFINVENKGYGYGNNRGCEYALNHYNFKYLVISNADIVIKSMNISYLKDSCITGPQIITRTGKNQNPYKMINSAVYEKIKHLGWVRRNKFVLYGCYAVNKLYRLWFLTFKKQGRVFSVHGAFEIFPKGILEKMYPVFDENIFLFAEEDDIAFKADTMNIHFEYNPKIHIYHKEDGSTGFVRSQFETTRKSALYVYDKWHPKHR